MLKTKFGRYLILLVLLVVGGFFATHNAGGFGVPFSNGQNDRPHTINNQRDHDGGVLRILIEWRGNPPQSILIGDSRQPERLSRGQIPQSGPSRVLRTYIYHRGVRYVGAATQGEPTSEGPLDCEITLDGIHVDGNRLPHGAGSIDCWILPA